MSKVLWERIPNVGSKASLMVNSVDVKHHERRRHEVSLGFSHSRLAGWKALGDLAADCFA